MKKIYLIQRAHVSDKTLSLVAKNDNATMSSRLSRVVDLDYMGSAEFEWGALPKSFRALQDVRNTWTLRKVSTITNESGLPLKVFSGMSDEEHQQYEQELVHLRYSEPGSDTFIRTKESTHFCDNFKPHGSRPTNIWWDIENHVVFSFLDVFMNSVETFVSNSLAYMDAQAKK